MSMCPTHHRLPTLFILQRSVLAALVLKMLGLGGKVIAQRLQLRSHGNSRRLTARARSLHAAQHAILLRLRRAQLLELLQLLVHSGLAGAQLMLKRTALSIHALDLLEHRVHLRKSFFFFLTLTFLSSPLTLNKRGQGEPGRPGT